MIGFLVFTIVLKRALSFTKDFIVLMIKMDDIPNTTPIGQDRKTLTCKALR